MKDLIFFLLFTAGLLFKMWDRYQFEKERKEKDYDDRFVSLYRENNLIYILIFLVLSYNFGSNLLGGDSIL